MKNQAIKKLSLLKRPFKAKKDGAFLFGISSFLLEIFKFLLISLLWTAFKNPCTFGNERVGQCEQGLRRHSSKRKTLRGSFSPRARVIAHFQKEWKTGARVGARSVVG